MFGGAKQRAVHFLWRNVHHDQSYVFFLFKAFSSLYHDAMLDSESAPIAYASENKQKRQEINCLTISIL
jgi:hypothetical protein